MLRLKRTRTAYVGNSGMKSRADLLSARSSYARDQIDKTLSCRKMSFSQASLIVLWVPERYSFWLLR